MQKVEVYLREPTLTLKTLLKSHIMYDLLAFKKLNLFSVLLLSPCLPWKCSPSFNGFRLELENITLQNMHSGLSIPSKIALVKPYSV